MSSRDRLAKAERIAVRICYVKLADAPGLIDRPLVYGFVAAGIQSTSKIFSEEAIHVIHANVDRASERAVACMLRELNFRIVMHEVNDPV